MLHVHAGVAPFAILSAFHLCTLGVHLLFWLVGRPACIRLPGSRCQTHYSKSFNLPCIYKCSHLAGGPIHCSLGSQSNLCPVASKRRSSSVELKLNDLQYVALVWVFMTVSSQNSRYTPFGGRTGASTAPTSCGASSPRVSAVQVNIHSGTNVACHALHTRDHMGHGLRKQCMICWWFYLMTFSRLSCVIPLDSLFSGW